MAERLAVLARAALATHARLQGANDAEPPSSEEEPYLPLDAALWLEWKRDVYDPAYAAWSSAMDALSAAMGDDFPGRHPFSVVPVCERLAAGGGRDG